MLDARLNAWRDLCIHALISNNACERGTAEVPIGQPSKAQSAEVQREQQHHHTPILPKAAPASLKTLRLFLFAFLLSSPFLVSELLVAGFFSLSPTLSIYIPLYCTATILYFSSYASCFVKPPVLLFACKAHPHINTRPKCPSYATITRPL